MKLDTSSTGLIMDDGDIPELNVEVYKGKQDVVIKVSDKGKTTAVGFCGHVCFIDCLVQGEGSLPTA